MSKCEIKEDERGEEVPKKSSSIKIDSAIQKRGQFKGSQKQFRARSKFKVYNIQLGNRVLLPPCTAGSIFIT